MTAHFIAGFIIGSIVTFGAIFLFCAFLYDAPAEYPDFDAPNDPMQQEIGDVPNPRGRG